MKSLWGLYVVMGLLLSGSFCSDCNCEDCTECDLLTKFSLVDQGSEFFLFRGASWTDSEGANYCRLKCSIEEQTGQTNFFVTDVSLLRGWVASEQTELEQEIEFFASQAEVGTVVHWPNNGATTPPIHGQYEWDEESMLFLAKTFNEWYPLVNQVQTLFDLKSNACEQFKADSSSAATSCMVYVHCNGGKDQTGEITTAYYMMAFNKTLSEALSWTCQEAGLPTQEHLWALSWFCMYKNLQEGSNVNNCLTSSLPSQCTKRKKLTRSLKKKSTRSH